jgi:hypothetical protein
LLVTNSDFAFFVPSSFVTCLKKYIPGLTASKLVSLTPVFARGDGDNKCVRTA